MAGRVNEEIIKRLQETPDRIRNVCILAHVDHGKTTLADHLIAASGIISTRQAGHLRYLDTRPDEQQLQITMKASSISLIHQPSGKRAEPHLINLIDSPGHVDFAGEASSATRLSDGCIVLVDVVEGICVQTVAVLQEAWREGVRPILVLNKMDRLFTELMMTGIEAYVHLCKLIERINAEVSTFLSADAMKKVGLDVVSVKLDTQKQWRFSPDLGNVIFTSATDKWGISVPWAARYYHKKMGMKTKILNEVLWGEHYYDPVRKKLYKSPKGKISNPIFVDFVLDVIGNAYQQILLEPNRPEVAKIASDLGVTLRPRDLQAKDHRDRIHRVLGEWLPISRNILDAVVRQLPSPVKAQRSKLKRLSWTTPSGEECEQVRVIKRAIKKCDPNSDIVVVYIAKMIPFAATSLSDAWQENIKWSQRRRRPYERGKFAKSNRGKVLPKITYPSIDWKAEGEENERKRESSAEEKKPEDGDNWSIACEVEEAAKKEEPRVEGSKTPRSEKTENSPSDSKPPTVSLVKDWEIDAVDVSYLLRVKDHPEEDEDEHKEGPKRFVGLARLFSGTLRKDSTVYVMSGKGSDDQPPPAVKGFRLFRFMGQGVFAIDSVKAGNVFGIAGLDLHVSNNATLSNRLDCRMLLPEFLSVPILRIAVEPVLLAEMDDLERGLKLLNRADNWVDILIQETGERVICAAGEVHLRRCIQDLRERFAQGIKFTVSKPIIQFRETVIGLGKKKKSRAVKKWTANDVNSFTVRALELPEPIAQLLGSNQDLLEEFNNSPKPLHHALLTRYETFLSEMEAHLPPKGVLKAEDLRLITSFGPRRGLLLNFLVVRPSELQRIAELSDKSTSFSSTATTSPQPEGSGEEEPILPTLEHQLLEADSLPLSPSQSINRPPSTGGEHQPTEAKTLPLTPTQATLQREEISADDLFVMTCYNSILNGFRSATLAGPLCDEPMQNVAFIIEEVTLARWKDEIYGPDPFGPFSGQVMSALREAYREAFLACAPRLVQPMYKVNLQVSSGVIGRIASVVSRRRGRILSEMMVEGTDRFEIQAMLPVVGSFQLATELRNETGGNVIPQMSFCGFEVIWEDPFWTPTTVEEVAEYGGTLPEAIARNNHARALIRHVRQRKGLQIEEKVVKVSTKQRTRALKR